MFDGIAALELRVATTEHEKQTIYRLRHDAYLKEGAIDQKPGGAFKDEYDDLNTSVLFYVSCGAEVVGSLRFTIQDSGVDPAIEESTPEFSVFPDEMSRLMQHKRPVACGSRFSIKPHIKNRTDVALLLLWGQVFAAVSCGAKWGVATVRGSHVKFYQRVLRMTEISAPRRMPGLKYDYALVASNIDKEFVHSLEDYPSHILRVFDNCRLQFEADLIGQVSPCARIKAS